MTGIVLALLAALALAFCVGSFLFARSRTDPAADFAFYRRQLQELEDGADADTLAGGDSEAARVEIGRRLLHADAGRQGSLRDSPGLRRLAATVSAVMIAAMVGLYWHLGTPELAGRPVVRTEAPVPAGAGDEAPSMPALLDQLRAHLDENPDDLRGWRLLGRSLLSMGEGAAAAAAYERAIALDPDDARLQVGLGEALVQIADGQVTAPARLAFLRAQRLDPEGAAPAYYLGLEALQGGDPGRALDIWTALAANAPEDAPWLDNLRRQMARARARMDAGSGSSQITEEQMAAVADMTDAERQEFVTGMVNRLESRLADNPDDWQGWLRLARARMVLGDEVAALAALQRAREVAPPSAESILTQEVETIRKKRDITK